MNVGGAAGGVVISAPPCQALPRAEHNQFDLDDQSNHCRSHLDDFDIDLAVGFILNVVFLYQPLIGPDLITHFAYRSAIPRSAADPTLVHKVHVTSALDIPRPLRQVHSRVVSSASAYFANPEASSGQDLPLGSISPHVSSKFAVQSYCPSVHTPYKLKTLAPQFFNVYRPSRPTRRPYTNVVMRFDSVPVKSTQVAAFGDGTPLQDIAVFRSTPTITTDAVRLRVTRSLLVSRSNGSILQIRTYLESFNEGLAGVDLLGQRAEDVRGSWTMNTAFYTMRRPRPSMMANRRPSLVSSLQMRGAYYRVLEQVPSLYSRLRESAIDCEHPDVPAINPLRRPRGRTQPTGQIYGSAHERPRTSGVDGARHSSASQYPLSPGSDFYSGSIRPNRTPRQSDHKHIQGGSDRPLDWLDPTGSNQNQHVLVPSVGTLYDRKRWLLSMIE